MVSDGDICIGACGGITQQDVGELEIIAPATNENDNKDVLNIPQATNIDDELEPEAELEIIDPPNDLIGAKETADTQQEAQAPISEPKAEEQPQAVDIQKPALAETLQPETPVTQSQQEGASPAPQDISVSGPDTEADPSEHATDAKTQQVTAPIQKETEILDQTGAQDEPEDLDTPAADTEAQPLPETNATETPTEGSSSENPLDTDIPFEEALKNAPPAADEPVSNDTAEEETIVEEQTSAAPVSEPEDEAAVAPEASTEDAAE